MKNYLLSCVTLASALAWGAEAHAIEITEPASYYLMHSSGTHLAKSGQKAVLEAADVAAPQMLTFTPDGNGAFTITAADGSSLSRSGSYNTVFTSNVTTANDALFTIEEVSGQLCKIKCRSNNKYLGVDNVEPGSSVYCDKDGSQSKHYWFLSTDPAAVPEKQSTSYHINPAAERQLFDGGWGVSLCWWANMCGKWSDKAIDEIVDWLVSPEGLNFRIFRYNIGGGDDPQNANCTEHHMGNGKGLRAEMEGFKDSSDGPYIWTRDAAQRKIMLKIKEKRPDAIFEAFSNSAPYYMTYSGCVSGNASASKDNLKPEFYDEFAHYLVDVCKHYKDEYGIEFKTLDPFNEPMTSYWGQNGGQEGCHFDVASQVAFIKVLAPILRESGLSTVISASDETSVGQAVNDVIAFRDAGVLDLIGQINTHTYTADNKSRGRLSYLCNLENKPLWMSEVGQGGTGLAGNLSLAQKLCNDMRYMMPSAWVDWQYIEENNDQWCLVKGNFSSGRYNKVKNYYVRSHFSRFIKEGYTILTTTDFKTLAARNPEGDELVLVALNTGALTTVHHVDLSMYASVDKNVTAYITTANDNMAPLTDYTFEGESLVFELPSESIATLVFKVSAPAEAEPGLRLDANYLICPRTSVDVALTAEEGGLRVRNVALTDAQIWHLEKVGDKYLFKNVSGDIITEVKGQYGLTTSQSAAEGQAFSIEDLDGVNYRVYTDENKAFDLSGESTNNGTQVGVWDYSDSATPVHRQWQFVALPGSRTSSVAQPAVAAEEAEAGFAVSNPAAGVLRVDRLAEGAGVLAVHNASGACIYSLTMSGESIELPVAAGFYVVTLDGTSTVTVVR